jgi:hypothetical protein
MSFTLELPANPGEISSLELLSWEKTISCEKPRMGTRKKISMKRLLFMNDLVYWNPKIRKIENIMVRVALKLN